MRRSLASLAIGLWFAGCGDDAVSPDAAATDAAPDAEIVDGCEVLRDPQAEPGDPIDGDTWETFAADFFAAYCTRCHASTLDGPDRNGAPVGYDWDVEATVREHLPEIRNVVGVTMYMPLSPPDPTCDERRRLVRWIDADAP